MDEIDCLQVEIIELEQRIIILKKLVQVKLDNLEKNKELSCLDSTLKECDREKDSKGGNPLASYSEYNHYVNSLIFS